PCPPRRAASGDGSGKRPAIADHPVQGRGGQGVISIQCSERNGKAVGAVLVKDDNEIMLISNGGTLIRTAVADISVMGRNTQGVRLVSLNEGEALAGLETIEESDEDEDSDPSASSSASSSAPE